MVAKYFAITLISIITALIMLFAILFVVAAIFMASYNTAVPGLIQSVDQKAKFQDIGYWTSISAIVLLAIVGSLLFKVGIPYKQM